MNKLTDWPVEARVPYRSRLSIPMAQCALMIPQSWRNSLETLGTEQDASISTMLRQGVEFILWSNNVPYEPYEPHGVQRPEFRRRHAAWRRRQRKRRERLEAQENSAPPPE